MLANFLFLAPANAYAQFGYGKRFYPESVDLEGEAISATQVTLTWRLLNQNREYYTVRIYRASQQAPDALELLTTVSGTTVSFTDSGLKPNQTYSYQIRFRGTYPTMLSRPSNVARVLTLDPNTDSGAPLTVNVPRYTTADPNIRSAITTLSAKATASNKILLQWGSPRMRNISSLRIFRADPDNPGEFIYLWSIGANQHSWVDETVYPKSTYSYILRYRVSSNGTLLSPPTNVATATTPDGDGPTKEPLYTRKNTLPKSNETQLSNVQGQPASINVTGYNRTSNDSAVPLDNREETLMYVINQYRASLGLGPVRPSVNLCRAADYFAKDMASNGLGISQTHNSMGQGAAIRARDVGYNIPTQFGTLTFVTREEEPADFLERLKTQMRDGDVMANPIWKTIGIARSYDGMGNWLWAVEFAAFWDFTIPLPGEDEDGRVDGNELVRTRPPRAALEKGSFFSGYGDDGKPYSTLHCDYSTKACWKDPVETYNRALEELSDPDELIGQWHVQSTMSSSGITHFNDLNGYDMSSYTINLQLNRDRTWVMQGYKAYQKPTPVEAGTWKSVHDISSNEELVTFYRDSGKVAATLRVHVAKDRLTFFVIEGKDFFQSQKFDGDKTDDAQVIFTRNFGFLLGPHEAFPANLRCASCPR
ncbi:MAG: hypothetical protein HOP19_04520 [Acidobacteria bacterium]|nr:hypothetical protein [Acidobacteriota bacterium]